MAVDKIFFFTIACSVYRKKNHFFSATDPAAINKPSWCRIRLEGGTIQPYLDQQADCQRGKIFTFFKELTWTVIVTGGLNLRRSLFVKCFLLSSYIGQRPININIYVYLSTMKNLFHARRDEPNPVQVAICLLRSRLQTLIIMK